ncbi:MAG: hypothetical protein ACRDRZ_02410 [Pseudonocardiaceae bacterium]
MQWLTDPDRAPSGRDLADALRMILADVGPVGDIDAAGTQGSGAPGSQRRAASP